MPAFSGRLAVLGAALATALALGQAFTYQPDREPVKVPEPFPTGWQTASPRDEIRPAFAYELKSGPDGNPAFVITAGDSVGQQGWVQKTFPVTGGTFYRFQAVRKADGVAVPRRSVIARIVWQDA